jgi:hypothetical protein
LEFIFTESAGHVDNLADPVQFQDAFGFHCFRREFGGADPTDLTSASAKPSVPLGMLDHQHAPPAPGRLGRTIAAPGLAT